MRVCLYTTTMLPKIGGQELAVHALSQELARQGHEVTVLSPTPRRSLAHPVAAAHDDARQAYRMVRHPRFVSTRWFVSFYGRFLRSLAASNGGFDVVNMTQHPECWLARELELCYANVSLVTDYDVGLEGMPHVEPVSADAAFAVFNENLERLRALLFHAVPRIGPQPEDACATALRSAIVR